MRRNPIPATILLLVIALSGAGAVADEFEKPALLRASEILSDKLRKGEYHRVDENVRSDGYLNYYVLRSDYGDWDVTSTSLLASRVREVEALAALDDVSKTEVFIKAAADAGVGQLKSIKEFASHPVKTVTGIPRGIGNLFRRYKRDADEAVKATREFVEGEDAERPEVDGEEGHKKDDSNVAVDLTESYFGVSRAQRAWHQHLGTDPYTKNDVLQKAIKSVAWADRLGRFGMKFASIPQIPGAEVIGEVNDAVWSTDPRELAEMNRARLLATGADEKLVDALLESPHYTPTQLTYLTAAITEMEGVKGCDGILRQAMIADTDAEVGFFVKSLTMLAWYHLNKRPVVEVLTESVIPRGVTEDGGAVWLLATDHVFWTDTVAAAADNFAGLRGDDEGRSLELWLLGGMSARTAKELETRDIAVHTQLVHLAN